MDFGGVFDEEPIANRQPVASIIAAEPNQRGRIWATDAFLSEFGAQNGFMYPRTTSGRAVSCHLVWEKYAKFLYRMVHMAELSLNNSDAEAWDALKKDDTQRYGPLEDVEEEDEQAYDSDAEKKEAKEAEDEGFTAPAKRTKPTGFIPRFFVDPEMEADQCAVLNKFHTLFTSELSMKILPVLLRLFRIAVSARQLLQTVDKFCRTDLDFYLSGIVAQVQTVSKMHLRKPGDFLLLPFILRMPSREVTDVDSHSDVSVIILEFENDQPPSMTTFDGPSNSSAAKQPNVPSASASANSQRAAHTPKESYLRLTIINPHPLTYYHPKAVLPENPSKIKQHVGVTALRIPRSKVLSEAWWSVMFLIPSPLGEKFLYTHMVSWLTAQPYVEMISNQLHEADLSSPVKFEDHTVFWKSLTYSLKFLLQRHAKCTKAEAKLARLGLRLAFVSELSADLNEMARIKGSSKVAIHCALRGMASAVARNETLVDIQSLNGLQDTIANLEIKMNALPTEEDTVTLLPPPIDITNGWDLQQQPDIFPLMECFRRTHSTDRYKGAKVEIPKKVVVNMSRIRRKVTTIVEAIDTIDALILLCTRIACQESPDNIALLNYTVIVETVIEFLPVPLGPQTRTKTGIKCLWTDFKSIDGMENGIRYGQQLHLLKRLSELAQFFFTCCCMLSDGAADTHLESIRLTVLANISAIADAVIRADVADCPSLFAQHYIGWKKGWGGPNGERPGFSIDSGLFAAVSAECSFLYPEGLLVRQAVIDYFDQVSSKVPQSNVIWRFRNGFNKAEAANVKMLAQIAKSLAITSTAQQMFYSVESNNSILCRNCLDFGYFRDITILFRGMTSRMDFNSGKGNWVWARGVDYAFDVMNGGFIPSFLGRTLESTVAKKKSKAEPEYYVQRPPLHLGAIGEEDILHMPTLGIIGQLCGLRDAELLLSYLTVPYLRIPLVLRFFSTEDRASLLRFSILQQLLSSVLFDAGRFLPMALSGQCPTMVPAEDDQLIATPYGHLLNELFYNPTGVIGPLTQLLGHILELDSGNITNEGTMNTIMFMGSMVAHTMAYLRTAKRMVAGDLGALDLYRDVNFVHPDAKGGVEEGYAKLTSLMLTKVLPIYLSWIDDLESTGELSMDMVAQRVANVRQHVLLLLRGLEIEAVDANVAKVFLSAMLYLTTRYTWRTYAIQEVLVFLTAQQYRHTLGDMLTFASKEGLSAILNYVVQAVTKAGMQIEKQVQYQWGLVVGDDCIARFCRMSDETNAALGKQNARVRQYFQVKNKPVPPYVRGENLVGAGALRLMKDAITLAFDKDTGSIASDMDLIPNGIQDVEIDLNFFTVTFKNAHLQALPIAGAVVDCDGLFASEHDSSVVPTSARAASLQCATVDITVCRRWFRLVAQDADVIDWRTSDPRIPLPSLRDSRFYPDDLGRGETWIYKVFEPVRYAYLERRFWEPPIIILMPLATTGRDSSVIKLSAVDSATGRLLKECYVYRDQKVVHFFDLFSFGRRFYRTQVYSSDARYSLYSKEISSLNTSGLPPKWGRFQCGRADPDVSHSTGESVCIVRQPHHPLNRSGSKEMYLPKHLLHGLIPSCLHDEYSFWQDDDDNIRGYPLRATMSKASTQHTHGQSTRLFGDAATKATAGEGEPNKQSTHPLLWIHWRELCFEASGATNTTVRIVRFADADQCPRSAEATIQNAYLTHAADYRTVAGLEALKLEADKEAGVSAPADLEAGAYQQALSAAPTTTTTLSTNASAEESNLLLVNLLNARAGTPLYSLGRVLAQIENLSHILVWTKETDYDTRSAAPLSLDLIYLPRLKLSFTARLSPDKTLYNVHSLDHPQLFISNLRPSTLQGLMQGMPFALVMADANQNITLLVPALSLTRPDVASSPFSTYVVPSRNSGFSKLLDTKYYLYPLHVSLSFLFTPSLAAALYLLWLRLLDRSYKEAFKLAGVIGTDRPLTTEEATIFGEIGGLRNDDLNSLSCYARIALMVPEAPLFLPSIVHRLLQARSYIDVECRFTITDEYRLLNTCRLLEAKYDIVREFSSSDMYGSSMSLVMGRIRDPSEQLQSASVRQIRHFYRAFSDAIRDRLDLRMTVADVDKLLMSFQANAAVPLHPYYSAILHNRYQVINAEVLLTTAIAEITSSQEGQQQVLPDVIQLGASKASKRAESLLSARASLIAEPLTTYNITVTTKVPPFGPELALASQPLDPTGAKLAEVRLEVVEEGEDNAGIQIKNKAGRPMSQSSVLDMYYCDQKECRKEKEKCPCGHDCPRSCGANNGGGCPCASCLEYNRTEGRFRREIPAYLDIDLNTRPTTFSSVLSWASSILKEYRLQPTLNQVDISRNGIPTISLRKGDHFSLFYDYSIGANGIRMRHARSQMSDVARHFALILFPLTYDSRLEASGLGRVIAFALGHPELKQSFHRAELSEIKSQDSHEILHTICTKAIALATELKTRREETTQAPTEDAPEQSPTEELLERLAERKMVVTRLLKDASNILSQQGSVDVTFSLRRDADSNAVLPVPADCDCSNRYLSMPDVGALNILSAVELEKLMDVQTSDEAIAHLVTQPLLPALLSLPTNPVTHQTRGEKLLPTVPSDLPFDLRTHAHARKTVAVDMLTRIESDMKLFADRSNSHKSPTIIGLSNGIEIRALATGKPSSEGARLLVTIDLLINALARLRVSDQEYLQFAMPVLRRTANQLGGGLERTDDETQRQAASASLRRFAGKEALMDLDFIVSSLSSKVSTRHWMQLNPFLNEKTCEAIANMTAIFVLRANRIAHTNRACDAAIELREWVEKAMRMPKQFCRPEEVSASPALQRELQSFIDGIVASLALKADALAAIMDTKRCYFERTGDREVPLPLTTTESTVKAGVWKYDARFLLFEFTWSIVLRDRQRELIAEMYGSVVNRKESIVKQMIMGAGKTTVVGPLLGAMLANGSNLVIQVVPPALLDFTRSVMRNTFSTVMRKQVFSFTCDRGSQVDTDLIDKFQHAKASRGIVVTTPNSIKSVFLKYIEALDKISDPRRANRSVDDEMEARDLLRIINMWKQSVLVMDEVDLILHPLKSELNFPVGPKRDIDFSPYRWKLPMHLLDALFFHSTRRITTDLKESPEGAAILKAFSGLVEEGLALNYLQATPHLILLNVEYYEEALKPLLAKWLALFIDSQLFIGLSHEDTLRYITRRPGAFIDQQSTSNYTSPAQSEAEKAAEKLFVERVSALDSGYVKVLNLAYEWLGCYLPHVWQKVDRVSYGIMNQDDIANAIAECPTMPQSRFVTAIPFIGKDLPSQSSEFAHPDIVIGLTILAYRYEGMRDRDFQEVMSDLYTQVEAEVGKFSQRRTNLLFNKWVEVSGGKIVTTIDYTSKRKGFAGLTFDAASGNGNNTAEPLIATSMVDILPLKLLKQANTAEIAKVFSLFTKTAEVIHFYLTETLFPTHMKHQVVKLSASGQELGGNMLFERRLGFSGTPSDLLPIELGHCGYEKGTDGQLIHTLTDPSVVKIRHVSQGWSAKSLLNFIARHEAPYRYHVLIDTGALISGMSNKQVAAYLLRHGLNEMDGVVFLDEQDRKMILVRSTGRVLRLAECGIPKSRRFAFYDQVHATGMDIEHIPNAIAAQTLSKDMTLRDLAQGAYRMRGIGLGQRIDLLVIPEVKDLITRSLAQVKSVKPSSTSEATDGISAELQDVTAWLLTNSMKAEHSQHDQLCLQSCANVWRKEAFGTVSQRLSEFNVRTINTSLEATQEASTGLSVESTTALEIFREPVVFDVAKTVPKPMLFSEVIAGYINASKALITTPEGKAVVQSLLERVRGEDELTNPTVEVQIVQEQEEEKDKEQQEEKEQQVEIEKYADLAYSRDSEKQVSWPLESLASFNTASQFYPLSSFHLYKRQPLTFPDSILVSRNFFNPRWSGNRRIRNVVSVIEWIPDTNALTIRSAPSCDYGGVADDESKASVAELVEMVLGHTAAIESCRPLLPGASDSANDTKDLVDDLLRMALEHKISRGGKKAEDEAEWSAVLDSLDIAGRKDAQSVATALHKALCGNALRGEEKGRYYVVLSLSEAETLRRVIHLRSIKRSLLRSQRVNPKAMTTVCLKGASCGFATLDRSVQHPLPTKSFMPFRTFQCLRFFDCDTIFNEQEFGFLLRSVSVNTPRARQVFFQQVSSCRRRNNRWERASIASIFMLASAFSLLRQRAVGMCAHRFIDRIGLTVREAYLASNANQSGTLTLAELWGALRYFKLDGLSVEEVVDFIELADRTHENHIQYSDFLVALTGSADAEHITSNNATEDTDDVNLNKKLPDIAPYGSDLLAEAMSKRAAQRRSADDEANQALKDDERRVKNIIEEEQIAADIELMLERKNPTLESGDVFAFDLSKRTIATLYELYGREYSDKILGKKPNALDDDDDEEEQPEEAAGLTSEERREALMKRPMTSVLPAIAKTFGARVRTTLDVDGDSCVTVHSGSTLSIPLRALARLIPDEDFGGYGTNTGDDDPSLASLAFFALTADIRFPLNSTVLTTTIPAGDQPAVEASTTANKKKARQQAPVVVSQADIDMTILPRLQSYTAHLSFADWMLPMVKRRMFPDIFFLNMVAHAHVGEKPTASSSAPMSRKEKARKNQKDAAAIVASAADIRTITLGDKAFDWINSTFFFMEETTATANGEGTLRPVPCPNPSAPAEPVLSTRERKGAPSRDVFGLRIMRAPQAPVTRGDILGVIMDNDCVIPTGESILSEVGNVAYEWVEISSPCFGWVVSRREEVQSVFVGVEEAEKKKDDDLPILAGMLDPDEAPAAEPSMVEPAAKTYMTFFDAIRTRALLEPNGCKVRIEHTRHPYEPATTATRRAEPLAALPPTAFSPSSAAELISDRELQLGKVVVANDNLINEPGKLAGDVEELLVMIVRAKELRKGCKVVRNPDHRNLRDGPLTDMAEVGKVTTVASDVATVQWRSGKTETYSWGANSVFELIKIADPPGQRDADNDDDEGDDDDDDDDDDTDPFMNDGGDLNTIGELIIANEEASCTALAPGKWFTCSSCYKKLDPATGWYRCNHCGEYMNLCRKCAKKSTHSTDYHHDFTDMAKMVDIYNGCGDPDLVGMFIGAKLRIKKTVTSPKFGWGEDFEERLVAQAKEREYCEGTRYGSTPFHWPDSLSGFIGTVTEIDRETKSITMDVLNVDGENQVLLVVLDTLASYGYHEHPDTVEFVGDYTELKPAGEKSEAEEVEPEAVSEEDEVVEEPEEPAPVFESSTSYTNLYRMMPHLYHLCSAFEPRLVTPMECTAPNAVTGELSVIPPLRNRLTEQKYSAMQGLCPHLGKLAEMAAGNLVAPFKVSESLMRLGKDLVAFSSADAVFVDPSQEARQGAYNTHKAYEQLAHYNRVNRKALEKTGQLDQYEEAVGVEDVSILEVGSQTDYHALFNVNRLDFQTLINAAEPFHLIRWSIISSDSFRGSTYTNDPPKAFTRQPFKIGSIVRYRNPPTDEKPYLQPPPQFAGLKPEDYTSIIGKVNTVTMNTAPGGKERGVFVYGAFTHGGVTVGGAAFTSDLDLIHPGQWFMRPTQLWTDSDPSKKKATLLREAAADDLTYQLSPEERLFYAPFNNAGVIPMSTAIASMLERGLRHGQQMTSVFIRDDNYDVDLKTGEVRRMKSSKELHALGVDEDLIDIPTMNRGQRDTVSKLFGFVYRVPPEPFVSQEKPPCIDDGLRHLISVVIKPGDKEALPTGQLIIDGKATPLSFYGCLVQLKDTKLRQKLMSQAMRLYFGSPISFFGCDFSTANNKGKLMEGPLCSAYNVRVDFDSTGSRDLMSETMKMHEKVALDTRWKCASCSHDNSRLLKRCAKCKRSRRAPVLGSGGDPSRYFRVATANGLETKAVRSRLQAKLKTQYQQELDLIDQAQELLEKKNKEEKAARLKAKALAAAEQQNQTETKNKVKK